MSRLLLVVLALLVGVVGCGAEEGVGEGAFVNVYSAAPLCAGAQGPLGEAEGRAGGVEVRLVCLRSVTGGGRLDLARLGRNARAATEDSAAVAYLSPPVRKQTEFLLPTLDAAGIPLILNPSGQAAMTELLAALEESVDSGGSLREAVSAELR